jgi:flagellar motor switch protein FliN
MTAETAGAKEVVVRSATFAQLGAGEGAATESTPLGAMLDVSVTLTAEFGKAVMPLGDVLKLGVGSVLTLDRQVSEPVELSVKGVLLARGEVVVVDDRFAVRIKEIVPPRARMGGRQG